MKEVWKAVPGFEFYDVSNTGRVRSWKTMGYGNKRAAIPHLLKPILHNRYFVVNFTKDRHSFMMQVHQLVMVTFKGPRSEGKQVSHINENPLDNRACNLAWATPRENSNMPLIKRRQSKAQKRRYANFENRKQTSASYPIGSSKFRGVTKHRRKWRAQIRIDRLMVPIGTYSTAHLAALAWDQYICRHKLPRVTNKQLGLL